MPIVNPLPPSENLYPAAINVVIPPANGPKKNAQRLTTIDLPSNIIPSAKTKGYIIPITAATPNKIPWYIFTVVSLLLKRVFINPEKTLKATSIERLYMSSTIIIKFPKLMELSASYYRRF